MPTFFDFSEVNAVPYPSGGYCTDRPLHNTRPRQLKLKDEAAEAEHDKPGSPCDVDNGTVDAQSHNKVRPIDVWRDWVPLTARKRIPPSFAEWARQHVPFIHPSSSR